MSGRRIATSAALIMAGNVGSRLLGLLREQTIAALFGTTAVASVFSAVSRVPTMVFDLLVGGAITAALVPVFSEIAGRRERRPDGAQPDGAPAGGEDGAGDLGAVAGTVIGLALAVLVPVVVVLMVFARPVMALLGVGFAPEHQELGVLLTRVAMPSVVLLGVAGVLMAVLYALHRVVMPSFAAAAYNLGIIVCALALSRWLGVTALVIGLLAGAAAQLLLQVSGLRGVRIRIGLDVRHPAVRRIAHLYAPVAGGLVVSTLVVILDTRLASLTGERSLAAMKFATTLVQLPLGLVATALSFAILPVLSRYGAGGAGDPAFRRTLVMGLRAALLLIAPLTVALLVLAEPIVRLVFERGSFNDADVALTTRALLFYAPQLPFVAVDQLLIAAFYALQNTRLPVLVGVLCAGIYAAVAIGTVDRLGMAGLVLANTVQNSAHAVILLAVLARLPGHLSGLYGACARIALAGAAAALATLALQAAAPAPHQPLAIALYLAVLGGCAGAVYLGTLLALRSEELAYVRSAVVARLAQKVGFR